MSASQLQLQASISHRKVSTEILQPLLLNSEIEFLINRLIIGSTHTLSEEDGLTTKQRILLAAKHRRHLHGKRKNYTSITDDLEMMIATSPPIDLPTEPESSPVGHAHGLPKFEIEDSEYLNDAEEVDYEMMETIIHKRLRR